METMSLGGALLQRTPVMGKIEYPSAELVDHINEITGEKSGVLGKANYVQSLARRRTADLIERQVAARKLKPFDVFGEGIHHNPPPTGMGLYAGHGLYAAPPPAGHGLYAGRHGGGIEGSGLKHHRLKREKGSVAKHGNLLHQPQALTPQPYSVNFMWSHTLPPYYQKYNMS